MDDGKLEKITSWGFCFTKDEPTTQRCDVAHQTTNNIQIPAPRLYSECPIAMNETGNTGHPQRSPGKW